MTVPHRMSLDDRIRRVFRRDLRPGEVVTSWVVIGGTRRADIEGEGGDILILDSGLAPWESCGLLTTALTLVNEEVVR